MTGPATSAGDARIMFFLPIAGPRISSREIQTGSPGIGSGRLTGK